MAMECKPVWNAIIGLILGVCIGTGILVLVILVEVKRMRMWAKWEVRTARDEGKVDETLGSGTYAEN